MHHLTAFAGLLVMPTHTWTEALALLLRWVHFLAGITWIGLLYFFNLVNVPFMKQVDAGMKPKVFQYMTLPTLQWFRWSVGSVMYWKTFGFIPDRKSTRLNSSHLGISYAVFCLKKKIKL